MFMNDKSYSNWAAMSDKALLENIGEFIQHHRLNQNKSQSEVAKAANISRSTLSLLERGENVSLSSLIQILRVLDLLHIMSGFKVSNEISPIEYARLQKDKRKRASNKRGEDPKEELGW